MHNPFWAVLRDAFANPGATLHQSGADGLASAYRVSDLAVASIGAAGAQLQRLRGQDETVTVDRKLASLWFAVSIRPRGWALPPLWDPIAGDYRARDGWIRLHTNAPHHRRAALSVLGPITEREDVATAVARQDGEHLESHIVTAGGCAAFMRTQDQWAQHPQGAAVAREPLVAEQIYDGRAGREKSDPLPERPLAGLRVLDLTRVLAGPVASRFLAAYGADVLRVYPPCWDEPGVVPEVTLGKRCAGLDLHNREDRAIFERLLSSCHVFLHGYRADALARLGYDDETVRRFNPGLTDIALNAYGWAGPWANRRGFDSLVQMSTGIAARGMQWRQADAPVPLPVQALDHATGYLLAAAALKGRHLSRQGTGYQARLSLARVAKLLCDHPGPDDSTMAQERAQDLATTVEETVWGPARRVCFPLLLEDCAAVWDFPAGPLRTAKAEWRGAPERYAQKYRVSNY